MSRLTANSEVAVRRGTTGPWTTFGVADGVGSWQDTDQAQQRPVPGIGRALHVQLLDTRDGSVSFAADDNSITAPLFFLRSGEVFQVRIRETGAGSGKPEETHEGVANISILNGEAGARSYQFSLTTTALTEATQ